MSSSTWMRHCAKSNDSNSAGWSSSAYGNWGKVKESFYCEACRLPRSEVHPDVSLSRWIDAGSQCY